MFIAILRVCVLCIWLFTGESSFCLLVSADTFYSAWLPCHTRVRFAVVCVPSFYFDKEKKKTKKLRKQTKKMIKFRKL